VKDYVSSEGDRLCQNQRRTKVRADHHTVLFSLNMRHFGKLSHVRFSGVACNAIRPLKI